MNIFNQIKVNLGGNQKTYERIYVVFESNEEDAFNFKHEIFAKDKLGLTIRLRIDDLQDKPSLEQVELEIDKRLNEFINNQQLNNSNVFIFASRKLGSIAMSYALNRNLFFIVYGPSINTKQEKIQIIREAQAKINNLAMELKEGCFGLMIYSEYDPYEFSYNQQLLTLLDSKTNVEIIKLEHYFYALDIKRPSSLINTCINKSLANFILYLASNLSPLNYRLHLRDPRSIKYKHYEREQTYHEIINGKNRCVKYIERKTRNSKFLLVSFSGEFTTDYNTEVTCAYSYFNYFDTLELNVLHIRSCFAISGGLSMYDMAEDYPQTLVANLIKQKCKEYGVEKKNVILTGNSAGGLASIFHAKKGKYPNIFVIAPILNPLGLFTDKRGQIFNIKELNDASSSLLKEASTQVINQINDNSCISGYIYYSSLDTCKGACIDSEFQKNNPNLKMIEYEKCPDFVDITKLSGSPHARFTVSFYRNYFATLFDQYLADLIKERK